MSSTVATTTSIRKFPGFTCLDKQLLCWLILIFLNHKSILQAMSLQTLSRLALGACCLLNLNANPLNPPMDLQWADSSRSRLSWAKEQKLDVKVTIPAEQTDWRSITVSPSSLTTVKWPYTKLEMRFFHDQLVEVTVWHAPAEFSAAEITARCYELKKRLAPQLGSWRANRRESTKVDGIIYTSQSWHVLPAPGLVINLALSEAEDTLRQIRKAEYTLSYSNQNLIERLQRQNPARTQDANPSALDPAQPQPEAKQQVLSPPLAPPAGAQP